MGLKSFKKNFLILFLAALSVFFLTQTTLYKVHAQGLTPAPAVEDPSQIYIETAKEILRRLFNMGNPENLPPGDGSSGGDGSGGGGQGSSSPNPDLASVLSWNQKINAALERGFDTYYDKMMANLSNGSYSAHKRNGANDNNIYWCTYSIVDAYNLAGKSGLNISAHGGVNNMRAFFERNQPSYKYLKYHEGDHQAILKQVQPGFAIFMQNSYGVQLRVGNQHTNMVGSINIDQRGNGTITTLDSNSKRKGWTYPVRSWNISNTAYPAVSFGGL